MRRTARTAADGVGARGWLEMGGEKKPLVMSDLGFADGKWVRRTARTAADGVGAREWLEMGGEKKPLVMSDLGCADGCGREMGAENCADGCGRRGCKGVAGNGLGRSRWRSASLAAQTAADGKWVQRIDADGCMRTAWVQRIGLKWVGRRSRW